MKNFFLSPQMLAFKMDIRGFWRCGLFDPLGCCKFDNGYDASQLIDALIELLLAGSGGENNKEMHRPSCFLSKIYLSTSNTTTSNNSFELETLKKVTTTRNMK